MKSKSRTPARSASRSSSKAGAQIIVDTLIDQGVDTMFGYTGGVVLPLFDRLYDAPINFVVPRHEQGGCHMADAYARASGKVGVVVATSERDRSRVAGIWICIRVNGVICTLVLRRKHITSGWDEHNLIRTGGDIRDGISASRICDVGRLTRILCAITVVINEDGHVLDTKFSAILNTVGISIIPDEIT